MAPSRFVLIDLAARQWLALRAASASASASSSARSSSFLPGAPRPWASVPMGTSSRAVSTSHGSSNGTGANPHTAAPATATAPANPPQPFQVRWVFLGPPGVGKGTYASRVAAALGIPHVACGDLVRAEIKAGSPFGLRAREVVAAGGLLPDELVLALVRDKLAALNGGGYLLDGFPRTHAQAEALFGGGGGGGNDGDRFLPTLAVNLSLREEVLVEKCIGRRVCGRCGKGFNVADIHLPASSGGGDHQEEIVMPPLNPPPECAPFMETREDDTEPVVRRRLDAYRAEAGPVEAFFADRGMKLDFEITGGIPQTLPRLARVLAPYHAGGEGVIGGGGSGGGGGRGGGGAAVDKNKRDKAKCGLEAAAASGGGGAAAKTAEQQKQQACG